MMRTPALVLLCAAALSAAEVVGPWNGFMIADGVAPTPVSLVLSEQRQQISGSISFNDATAPTPIETPELRDDRLTFQIHRDNRLMTFQLTVALREMTGEAVTEGRTLKVQLTPTRRPNPYETGTSTPPQVISRTTPEYSEEARAANYQGTVLISAEIMPDGQPANLKVARAAGMGLDEKALECVAKWRFRPATKNGEPISRQITIEVTFRLK